MILQHKETKDKSPEMDCVETELSDAKRTARDVALKIEEANSRAKRLQRKPKWCQQEEEAETSLKNKEDAQYAQVIKELEHVRRELGDLKLDIQLVLKEKRDAEKASKASSSKAYTLSASMGLIKKEIQELGEEQVLVELARIEAVKEFEAIESMRKEDENRYQTQLSEAKEKEEEVAEEKEMTRALQMTLSDINLLENELNLAKKMDKRVERTESMARKQERSLLHAITNELEAAKTELATIKGEGFSFMTSMDVIRDELKHVRDETARLQKAEQKRDTTVQNLNSKILRGRAKLEALTAAERKTNEVSSDLVIALEQLRAEAEAAKKEKDLISNEIENMKREVAKTESEIELAEKRLEAAMEELKAVKSSESKSLEDLRNLINTTVEARYMASTNSSLITITNFEYEYLLGNAGEAKEIADKKIAAAQAWVEALKTNEREILMKAEMTQREITELNVEVEEEAEIGVYRTNPIELPRSGKNGAKVMASPRRSVYRIGTMASAKRAKSLKLRSPAARYNTNSPFLSREKVMPNLAKFFSNKNNALVE